ncbi:Re/Si-specific NAD(P)(+) transhydrogenase subunit alpha [Adlercreutzia sp. ZJ141]|uniref:Re/Si-specific NAD(P)(+) transhydrogenase subunit alpha n=1 Tax=Adlercreutzia sp. ZJ141 TaxID=2709406 RepID=UPI0013EB1B43|nr:Re/Si-specific NAD(P)(+) transhydrogenase subunit alpha [Adlercreutzia sp. ZJ141]
MRIGIPKEQDGGQTLVAGTPDTVKKLIGLGYDVAVETGAGEAASFPDADYTAAGASVVDGGDIWSCDIVTCLDTPSAENIALMRRGSTLIARMNPAANPALVQLLAERGITGLAIDVIPRISRAQSMDVRSSMANVGGYRAVIEAASAFGRLFTGQVTAAGKMPPARVYIIGVGVAGLAAIGTAKSMGAIVSATDVRADVADQVRSLDAEFVAIPVVQQSDDGYAKAMTSDQEKLAQQVYAEQAKHSDIVITTAQIPGKKPPVLLTASAVAAMKPGSVIVDMSAGANGGNCELTRADECFRTENGVTIIGFTDLARRLPGQSSQLYGQNIMNFFKLATPEKNGQLTLDENDDVIRGVTVALDGAVMWPPPAVKVSAAPSSTASPASSAEVRKTSEANADAKSANAAHAAQTDAASARSESPKKNAADSHASTPASAFKRWWWKIALSVAGLALVFAAPEELAGHFFVFELACVAGFYVITNVTHALHTPLMSVTNAISGIIVIGALLQIGSSNPVVAGIAFVAALLASINIFGGFLVTRRMLGMFQRSSEE